MSTKRRKVIIKTKYEEYEIEENHTSINNKVVANVDLSVFEQRRKITLRDKDNLDIKVMYIPSNGYVAIDYIDN